MGTRVRERILAVTFTVIMLSSVPVAALTAPTGAVFEGDVNSTSPSENMDPSFTEASDNVSVWDRSIFPLRTSREGAVNELALPSVFVSSPSQAEANLNKEARAYETGRTFTIDFSNPDAADTDTTQFNGDELTLIAARATPDGEVNDVSLGTALNVATDLSESSVNQNFTFVSETPTSTVSEGEASFDLSVSDPGEYVFIVTRSGSNVSISNGDISLDGEVEVLGVDTAPVQTQSSDITVTGEGSRDSSANSTVQPGESFEFDLDSNIESSSVSHAVLLIDEDKFAGESIRISTDEEDLDSLSSDDIIINRSFEGFNGRTSVASDTSVAGFGIQSQRTTGVTTLASVFDLVAEETPGDGPIDNAAGDAVIDASVNVTSDSGTTVVTVDTLSNFSRGEYKLLYVATDENEGESTFTTSNKTVFVKRAVALNIETSRDSAQRGQSITFTVTDDSTESEPVEGATVTFGESSKVTDADGTVTFSTSGLSLETQTATVDKTPNETAVFQEDTVTVDIDRRSSTRPPRDDDDDEEEEEPDDGGDDGGEPTGPPQTIRSTDRGAQVTIQNVTGNTTVRVDLNNTTSVNGTGVDELDLTPGTDTENISIDVTRPRSTPTENAPSLEGQVPTSRAASYFSINVSGVTDGNVRANITFRLARENLAEGDTPEDVALYRFTDGEWRELPTAFLGDGRYRAQTQGFSPFAAGVEEERAVLNATDTSITDRTLTPGEETTAQITVSNIGNINGSFDVVFTADGQELDTQTVTLAPNESQQLSVTTAFDEPGLKEIVAANTTVGFVNVIQPPAEFEVRNLDVGSREVTAGDDVTVTATVANTGGQQGSFDVALTLNGEVVDTQTVSVQAGETTQVEFTVTLDELGEQDVTIGGVDAGTVTVVEATPTPTEVVTTTPQTTQEPLPGFTMVLAVIAILATALLARRRED